MISSINSALNSATSMSCQDFIPMKCLDRFYYICLLEKGIPFPAVLCTYSVGASVGNYHFIWKIPEHSNPSVLATENQRVIDEI